MSRRFLWHLSDPDRPPGRDFYREGEGFGALVDALRDFAGNERAHTPDGLVPSGHLAIYWHDGSQPTARAGSEPTT